MKKKEGWILNLRGGRNCSCRFKEDFATISKMAFDSRKNEDQMIKVKDED